jgi:choline kinase
MKAIILSAGQGRRLLPLTAEVPKCALQIERRSLIEWQIDALLKCGVHEVIVVLGFRAEKVESILASRYDPSHVRVLYNPFYSVSDNLVSCWIARAQMTEDFLLLNGDTLFETAVLARLLRSSSRPVTLATDRKQAYDIDDMKVMLNGNRVIRVDKNLKPEQSHRESIGMLLFRDDGPLLFAAAVERALREPRALKQWYLSVIDDMAKAGLVWQCSIQGLHWTEVDCDRDLEEAQKLVAEWKKKSRDPLAERAANELSPMDPEASRSDRGQ